MAARFQFKGYPEMSSSLSYLLSGQEPNSPLSSPTQPCAFVANMVRIHRVRECVQTFGSWTVPGTSEFEKTMASGDDIFHVHIEATWASTLGFPGFSEDPDTIHRKAARWKKGLYGIWSKVFCFPRAHEHGLGSSLLHALVCLSSWVMFRDIWSTGGGRGDVKSRGGARFHFLDVDSKSPASLLRSTL